MSLADSLPSNSKIILVVSDSLSYWYPYSDTYKPIKKSAITFGKKLISHGTYFNKYSKDNYSTAYYNNKTGYIYKLLATHFRWVPLSNSKQIIGYQCKVVLAVDNRDSILVYYSEDLAFPAGPFYNYNNLPGTPLEMFDQKRGIHLTAEKIEFNDYVILFPKKGKLISAKEHEERLQKAHSSRE